MTIMLYNIKLYESFTKIKKHVRL